SGKIKAWVYAVAGGAGIAVVLARGFLPLNFQSIAETLAQITFYACAATAVWTMIDYALAYRRLAEKD
ncbi:MAG TPA: hypothetical protein PK625_05570, partial [Spirochaetales bacterium]|nr:hypothetical protein [Spirochaetales bacterium]